MRISGRWFAISEKNRGCKTSEWTTLDKLHSCIFCCFESNVNNNNQKSVSIAFLRNAFIFLNRPKYHLVNFFLEFFVSEFFFLKFLSPSGVFFNVKLCNFKNNDNTPTAKRNEGQLKAHSRIVSKRYCGVFSCRFRGNSGEVSDMFRFFLTFFSPSKYWHEAVALFDWI